MIYAGVDIETTDLLSPDHRIIEVYIGLWNGPGKPIFEFDQRIDPQRSISAEAQRVHGISGADLVGKPAFDTVAGHIVKVLGKGDLWVAHNGEDFDFPFLKQEITRVGQTYVPKPIFDTMKSATWATHDGKMPRLQELCFACGIDYDPGLAHAAHYDVHRMMDCFWRGLDWGFYTLSAQPIPAAA